MEIKDMTGQLRSEDDLKEALKAVENGMIKQMMEIPPQLFLLLPTIREALIELLKRREIEKQGVIGGMGGKKSNTGHTGGLDRANMGLNRGISENG